MSAGENLPIGQRQQAPRSGYRLMVAVGLTFLVAGGVVAVTATGVLAWCGMLKWGVGTLTALWAVATAEASPTWPGRTFVPS